MGKGLGASDKWFGQESREGAGACRCQVWTQLSVWRECVSGLSAPVEGVHTDLRGMSTLAELIPSHPQNQKANKKHKQVK